MFAGSFKDGEWIQLKLNGEIGFVLNTEKGKPAIYIPSTHEMIRVEQDSVHAAGSSIHSNDIEAMIDLALMTNDESWMRRLCAKHQVLKKRETGKKEHS